MAHVSSGHQAYIVNMLEHGGMKVLKSGKLSTCRIIPEVITKMTISR